MNQGEKILFFFEKVDKFNFDEKNYREWIRMIIESEGSVPGFLNLIFTNDNVVQELNKRYLKRRYFTDVIAFDYGKNENEEICGDIFISIERVRQNSTEYGQTFEREMLRVISHGILHLLGYNDKTEEDKRKIKNQEDIYIERYLRRQ